MKEFLRGSVRRLRGKLFGRLDPIDEQLTRQSIRSGFIRAGTLANENELRSLAKLHGFCSLTQALDNFKENKLSWEDLKEISYFIDGMERGNEFFEEIITRFDPTLGSYIRQGTDKEFVGSGFGGSTLNCYRKVVMPSLGTVLQKYYNNQSDDLRRSAAFYDSELYRDLKKTVRIPKIKEWFYGKLVVANFEYLNLTPVESLADYEDRVIKAIRLFMNFGRRDNSALKSTEYANLWIYGSARRTASLVWQSVGYSQGDMERWEKHINENDFGVLSNGDVTRGNVLKEDCLIDFDCYGIYPSGFLPGIAFAPLVSRFNAEQISAMLADAFLDLISPGDHEVFIYSSLFFISLFGSEVRSPFAFDNLRSILIALDNKALLNRKN